MTSRSGLKRSKSPLSNYSLALLIVFVPCAHAQFWIRDSTVLPEALTGGGASGRDGTKTFSAATYGGLEFNDNVTLSESPDSGLAARFGVTGGFRYPISENNELSFDLSLERLVYLSGVSGSTAYNNILPGSETTFTVFIGSVRVRTFLKASLTEDPTESPVINNVAQFGRFTGQLGTQVDWDMNRVIWQGTAAASRQFATQKANEQIDSWNYAVGLRAVAPLGPAVSVGVSTTYALTRYDEAIQNDSTTRSAGVFTVLNLSRTMSLQAATGLQWTDYDDTGSIADQTDREGVYASLGLSHQIHRRLGYTFSVRHDIDEGYGTNFYEITDVSLSPRFKMVNKWELVGTAGWQWIDESGPTGESAQRLILSVEARRPLGRKLDLSAGYAHYEKFSDQVGKDYVQNRIYFSVRYTF